jgi:hypothetical protein
MKAIRVIRLVEFSAVLAGAVLQGAAYELQWVTVDGGGGTVAGGAYVADVTIGQAEAATAAGGGYVLQLGFWPGPWDSPFQPTPVLRPERRERDLVLAWPAGIGQVVLEKTPLLGDPSAWEAVPVTPVQVGDELQVVLPQDARTAFFRLRLGP